MRICFITAGEPGQTTGASSYRREVFGRLRAAGATVDKIVVTEDLAAQVRPRHYDVLLIDSAAWAAARLWIDSWRASRPLVALADDPAALDAGALRQADWLIALSRRDADDLESRGGPRERIMVAAGGGDQAADLASWDDTSDRVANALGAAIMRRMGAG